MSLSRVLVRTGVATRGRTGRRRAVLVALAMGVLLAGTSAGPAVAALPRPVGGPLVIDVPAPAGDRLFDVNPFRAGTQVLAQDETGAAVPVAIETVEAGHLVWSRDDRFGEQDFGA